MWILDGESNDVVERFPVTLIHQPTAFNDHNHIYNNILIFTVQLPNESQGNNKRTLTNIIKVLSKKFSFLISSLHCIPFIKSGELHIFQCVSHNAINIVEDIQQWMRHFGVMSNSGTHSEPSLSQTVNVSVKETVSVFNQIAAQREK